MAYTAKDIEKMLKKNKEFYSNNTTRKRNQRNSSHRRWKEHS